MLGKLGSTTSTFSRDADEDDAEKTIRAGGVLHIHLLEVGGGRKQNALLRHP